MNINGYMHLRDLIISAGDIISGLILVFSLSLILFTLTGRINRRYKNHANLSEKLLIIVLSGGFLLILYFHIGISQNIYLSIPGMGVLRFYVPPWIETEKLYFWTVIIAVIMSKIRVEDDLYRDGVRVLLSLFSILIVLLSNPFTDPLPQFHKEITTWNMLKGSPHESQYLMYLVSKLLYFYNSAYMWLHPPALFISYAFLTLALPGSVGMIFRKNRYDMILVYRFIRPGYLFLTFGLILGYPWAIQAWEGEWWWDPKITGSLVMWTFYTAMLHTMIYRNRLYRVTGIIGVLCFVFLVYTYLLTYIGTGVHAYG